MIYIDLFLRAFSLVFAVGVGASLIVIMWLLIDKYTTLNRTWSK